MSTARHEWKSWGALTVADLEREPIWGFDLGAEDEAPDETCVRPYHLDCIPNDTDSLFVAARLRTASGAERTGALQARFDGGELCLEGLVLVEPMHLPFRLESGEICHNDRDLPLPDEVVEAFPLAYRSPVRIGSMELHVEGVARLEE
jgi:hypothetical protein